MNIRHLLVWVGVAIGVIAVSYVRWSNLFYLGFAYDTHLFYLWGRVPLETGFINFWRDYRELFDYLPGSVYLFMLLGTVARLVELNESNFVIVLKVLNWLSEIGFAVLVYYTARRYGKTSTRWAGVLAALAYTLPAFWFVSSVWGQIDTLIVALAILGVIFLYRAVENTSKADQIRFALFSGVVFALGFWVKMQLILLVPLIALFHLTWRQKRVFIYQLIGGVGVTLLIIAIPLLVNPGRLLDGLVVPFTRSEAVSRSANSLWTLIGTSNNAADPVLKILGQVISIRLAALILLISLNLIVIYHYFQNLREGGGIRKKLAEFRLQYWDFTYLATVQTISFFLIMTKMHERYLHFGAMFLVLCVAARGTRNGLFRWLALSIGLNLGYFLNVIGSFYANGYREPGWVEGLLRSLYLDTGRLASLTGILCLVVIILLGRRQAREHLL